MTTKADFTPEEWEQLFLGPFNAGFLIIGADKGWLGIPKEYGAMQHAMQKSVPDAGDQELINELVADVKRKIKEDKILSPPDETDKVKTEEDWSTSLKHLGEIVALVAAKATPEETEAYKQWVMSVAQATAEAAKEGGMFGKKVLVSDKEKEMLGRIAQALETEAA